MRALFPSHLYIRIDRPLRGRLLDAAERAGLSVSELVRRTLHREIADPAAREMPSSTATILGAVVIHTASGGEPSELLSHPRPEATGEIAVGYPRPGAR